MSIKSHIVCASSEELAKELELRNIDYGIEEDPLSGEPHIVFDVLDLRDSSFLPSDSFILESPYYTEEELDKAEWLICRCINAKVTLNNEERSFSLEEVYENGKKAQHRYPSGAPFYVRSAPKHRGSRGFFSSHSLSEYDLFCTERAKRALLDAFPDIEASFDPVLSSKTDEPVEDLYFMNAHCSLGSDSVDLSEASKFRCPVCGKESFAEPMQLTLKEAPSSIIAKTPRCFSYGGNLEYSVLIVSQSFRRALIENDLAGGLVFETVDLRT